MVKSRVITPKLALAHRSDGNLAEFVAQRINSISENAAVFSDMYPALATLKQHYADFKTALENCGSSGNRAVTSAKNDAREVLCTTMIRCAQSCSEIAGDDQTLFSLTGFDVKSKGTKLTAIGIPDVLKIAQGSFEGSIYCSFAAVKGARNYEINFGKSIDNMNDWDSMFTSSSRKVLITDLPSLSKCYLRIRALGPRCLMSEWSTVTEFKVL